MTATGYFVELKKVIEQASVSNAFYAAVHEWAVSDVEDDPQLQGVCVCGKTGLGKLFTIRNDHNEVELFPIGSHCVKHFGREDLNNEVTLLTGLLELRNAIIAKETITLESGHFTRAMFPYFLKLDAFPPNYFNGGDGSEDSAFLLKMFNKRKKDDISTAQRKKIWTLINKKVLPAVLADERLK